jgi:hypothetical protein
MKKKNNQKRTSDKLALAFQEKDFNYDILQQQAIFCRSFELTFKEQL